MGIREDFNEAYDIWRRNTNSSDVNATSCAMFGAQWAMDKCAEIVKDTKELESENCKNSKGHMLSEAMAAADTASDLEESIRQLKQELNS